MTSRLLLTPRHLYLRLHLKSKPKTSFINRTMVTFTIPSSGDAVDAGELTVNSTPENLSREQLLAFPAFKIWLSTLQRSLARQKNPSHEFHKNPYVLRGIEIQAVDFFRGGRLGFVKLRADVSNQDGESLPGSVFLRGGSVGILVSYIFVFFLKVQLVQGPGWGGQASTQTGMQTNKQTRAICVSISMNLAPNLGPVAQSLRSG